MTGASTLHAQALHVFKQANGNSNRIACWISRAALEQAVDDLLGRAGCASPTATMRSKLVILANAYQKEQPVVAGAAYLWAQLSRACHYHAFELSPTSGEVDAMLKRVGELVDYASTDPEICHAHT